MSAPAKDVQFQLTAGHVSLDLANTIDNRGSSNEIDLIPTYAHLLEFARECRVFAEADLRNLERSAESCREAAHRAARQAAMLRETIFEIFSALARKMEPSVASLKRLNTFVNEAGRHRVIARENGGFGWKWAEVEDNPQSVLWPFAWQAADLLSSGELQFVRECDSPTCSWLFLDKSKSHSRRWCDMKVCGNRVKARRFYQRRGKTHQS